MEAVFESKPTTELADSITSARWRQFSHEMAQILATLACLRRKMTTTTTTAKATMLGWPLDIMAARAVFFHPIGESEIIPTSVQPQKEAFVESVNPTSLSSTASANPGSTIPASFVSLARANHCNFHVSTRHLLYRHCADATGRMMLVDLLES